MVDKRSPDAVTSTKHAADLDWLYNGKLPHTEISEPEPMAQVNLLNTTSPAAAKPKAAINRNRHPFRIALIIVLALVISWVAFMVYAPLHAWSSVERVNNTPSAPRPADTPGTLFLLVGGDSRDSMTEEEREKYGTGYAEGNRTDTMMLYYIPPTGRPALISLPRDSYVDIPGYGFDKLNAAYAYGGAPLLTATVERLSNLHIDGYVEISMSGFAKLIDYVGGINICVAEDISDVNSGLYLDAGCHDLDARTALAYVRMRYADPRGDLGRVERQRETISLVAQKLLVRENVLLPWRWWDTTHELIDLVAVGSDTTIGQLWDGAMGGLKVVSAGALLFTVPISDADAFTDAGSSVLLDTSACSELFAEIAAGDTANLDRFINK